MPDSYEISLESMFWASKSNRLIFFILNTSRPVAVEATRGSTKRHSILSFDSVAVALHIWIRLIRWNRMLSLPVLRYFLLKKMTAKITEIYCFKYTKSRFLFSVSSSAIRIQYLFVSWRTAAKMTWLRWILRWHFCQHFASLFVISSLNLYRNEDEVPHSINTEHKLTSLPWIYTVNLIVEFEVVFLSFSSNF